MIAILLGAVVGLVASFAGAMFPTPRAQLTSLVLFPIPMVAGLCLGLGLGSHRVLALGSLSVVLAVGAYCRRFGPRGFFGGQLVFMGDFFGFFLHGTVVLSDVGWLTAEIGIGVLVAVLAQFTLFFPSRRAALRRMQRSAASRARQVAAAALGLMDDRGDRQRALRRLQRLLVRLNETALMVDAQLGDPAALPAGSSAVALHQRLFDAELALTDMARLAAHIAELELPGELREQVRAALAAVADRDPLRAELAGQGLLARLRSMPTGSGSAGEGPHEQALDRPAHVVVHRFAVSVLGYVQAAQAWRSSVSTTASDGAGAEFEPSVALFGGWLPGSTTVSADASLEGGSRPWGRLRLAPYSRVAIQMGVAVTAAIVLGDALDGRRFYWAVIAAFVTFMGANNATEQLRKGFFRVAGTVVGVLLGATLAHLVGQRTGLSIAVILISLFLGLYLMRINYAFMVIGITVMVSQLYVQLDEFSDSLLLLRLAETALGAAVAAVTVLVVLPLHGGRVARVATRQYVQALAAVAQHAVHRLLEPVGDDDLRAAARRLDAAYQALVVTMTPLRVRFPRTADSQREQFLHSVSASRNYARTLLTDTAVSTCLGPQVRDELERAGQRLAASCEELVAALQNGDAARRRYVRSASLFDLVATRLDERDFTAPPQLALRDLQVIDGAMAALARSADLDVQALDTAGSISE